MTKDYKKANCGYIALVGQPNVGKSTILNKVIGKKVSIISSKPQTTQRQILAVKTTDNYQLVFVDTPGLHKDLTGQQKVTKNILSKYMARAVTQAIRDVDLLLFIISGTKWDKNDDFVLEHIKQSKTPCILVINKIDKIKDKSQLLPFVQNKLSEYNFAEVFYISALKDNDLLELQDSISKHLPEVDSKEDFYFNDEYITNQNNKLQAAEIIREKVIKLSNQEIPYSIAVEIENFKQEQTKNKEPLFNIRAIIWVEREGQKIIIIGSKGENIKKIGISARLDLESILGEKVHLEIWIKIKSNWSSDQQVLKTLGFNNSDD